jgi:hypothetical protein
MQSRTLQAPAAAEHGVALWRQAECVAQQPRCPWQLPGCCGCLHRLQQALLWRAVTDRVAAAGAESWLLRSLLLVWLNAHHAAATAAAVSWCGTAVARHSL